MFKIKIPKHHEDKFMVLLQVIRGKVRPELFEVKSLDIDDADYLYFILEYKHPKFINMLLGHIKDYGDIIDCRIHYAFVYTLQEAYTNTDNVSNYPIIYNRLC